VLGHRTAQSGGPRERIFQAAATEWGLFRYRWLATKLALTVVATVILLVKIPLIRHAAQLAIGAPVAGEDLRRCGMQLAFHAAGGLGVLLAITAISVFKPWGRIGSARRRHLPTTRMVTQPTTPMPAMLTSDGSRSAALLGILVTRHTAFFHRMPLARTIVHVVIGITLVGMLAMHLAVHALRAAF